MIDKKVSIIRKYIQIFLNEKTPFNILYEKYPEIREDLTSARELVDCSCRSKVVFFLEEKIKNAEDLNLINEILLLPEVQKVKEELDYEFEQEILAFKKKIKKENNAKKIYTVSRDENEWKEFVEYAKENIEFKSFSIIEKENHLEVRFI